MSSELKTCPFCGSEITRKNINFGGQHAVYFLICPKCRVQIGDNWKGEYGSAKEVAQIWNTRAE